MGAIYGKYQAFKSNNIISKADYSTPPISKVAGKTVNGQIHMDSSNINFWLETSLPPALYPPERPIHISDTPAHNNFHKWSSNSTDSCSKQNCGKRRKLDSDLMEENISLQISSEHTKLKPVSATVLENKKLSQKRYQIRHHKAKRKLDDFIVSTMVEPPKPYKSIQIMKPKSRMKKKIKPVHKISLAVRNFKRTSTNLKQTLQFIKSTKKRRRRRNLVRVETILKNSSRQVPGRIKYTNKETDAFNYKSGLNVRNELYGQKNPPANYDLDSVGTGKIQTSTNSIQTNSQSMKLTLQDSSVLTELPKTSSPNKMTVSELEVSNATYVVSNPAINYNRLVNNETTNVFGSAGTDNFLAGSSLGHSKQLFPKQHAPSDNIAPAGLDELTAIESDSTSSSGSSSSTLFPKRGLKLASFQQEIASASILSHEPTPPNDKYAILVKKSGDLKNSIAMKPTLQDSSILTELPKISSPNKMTVSELDVSNATYVVSNPAINHNRLVNNNATNAFGSAGTDNFLAGSSLGHSKQLFQKQHAPSDNIAPAGLDELTAIESDSTSSSGSSSSTLFPKRGLKLASFQQQIAGRLNEPNTTSKSIQSVENGVKSKTKKLDINSSVKLKGVNPTIKRPRKRAKSMSSSVVNLANERRASLRSSVRKIVVPNGSTCMSCIPHDTNIQQTPITSHPVNKEKKVTRKSNRQIMPPEPIEQILDPAEIESALNQTYTINTGEKEETIVEISQPKVVIERLLEIEQDPSQFKLPKKTDSSCSGSTFDGRWSNIEAWNRSNWNKTEPKHGLESTTNSIKNKRRSPYWFGTPNQSSRTSSRKRMELSNINGNSLSINEIAAKNIGGNRSNNPDSLSLLDPISTNLISESIKENTPELNSRTYLRTPGSKQEMITKSITQFTPENIKDLNELPENLNELHVNNLQAPIKFAVPKQTTKTKRTRKCQPQKTFKNVENDRRSHKALEDSSPDKNTNNPNTITNTGSSENASDILFSPEELKEQYSALSIIQAPVELMNLSIGGNVLVFKSCIDNLSPTSTTNRSIVPKTLNNKLHSSVPKNSFRSENKKREIIEKDEAFRSKSPVINVVDLEHINESLGRKDAYENSNLPMDLSIFRNDNEVNYDTNDKRPPFGESTIENNVETISNKKSIPKLTQENDNDSTTQKIPESFTKFVLPTKRRKTTSTAKPKKVTKSKNKQPKIMDQRSDSGIYSNPVSDSGISPNIIINDPEPEASNSQSKSQKPGFIEESTSNTLYPPEIGKTKTSKLRKKDGNVLSMEIDCNTNKLISCAASLSSNDNSFLNSTIYTDIFTVGAGKLTQESSAAGASQTSVFKRRTLYTRSPESAKEINLMSSEDYPISKNPVERLDSSGSESDLFSNRISNYYK